jgi:hypothetical protein
VNLIGLYKLGRLVESWYGPWGMVIVYVVTGFFGNLFACLLKPYFGPGVDLPSAGGSVVVCGLIAEIGVVGWRSRTRFGDFVGRQMLAVLVLTGLLGVFLPLDNLGHAGGALVGAILGLFHRALLRQSRSARTRLIGLIAAGALLLSLAIQAYTAWGGLTAGRYPRAIEPPGSPNDSLSSPNSARLVILQRPARVDLTPPPVRLPARGGIRDLFLASDLVHELGRRGPIPWSTHEQLTTSPLGNRGGHAIRARLYLLVRLLGATEGIADQPRDPSWIHLRRSVLALANRAPTPGEVAAFDRDAARLAMRLNLLSKVARLRRATPPRTIESQPGPGSRPADSASPEPIGR